MLRHAAQAGERRGPDAHAEMRAVAQAVGARVARVRGAFVDDFQRGGREGVAQPRLEGGGGGDGQGVHASERGSSSLMCRAM